MTSSPLRRAAPPSSKPTHSALEILIVDAAHDRRAPRLDPTHEVLATDRARSLATVHRELACSPSIAKDAHAARGNLRGLELGEMLVRTGRPALLSELARESRRAVEHVGEREKLGGVHHVFRTFHVDAHGGGC